jgi:T5SS/PEP-CTERM-associated repeat protein
MRSMLGRLSLACCVGGSLLYGDAGHAAPVAFWTAGDGDWSTPENWDCKCVPGAGFVVNTGSGNVNVDISPSVFSLTGTGSLRLDGTSLTATSAAGIGIPDGTIQLSGGASIDAPRVESLNGNIVIQGGSSISSPFVGSASLLMQNSSIVGFASVGFGSIGSASISGSQIGTLSLGGALTLSDSTIGSNSSLQLIQNSSIANSQVDATISVDLGASATIDRSSRITSTQVSIGFGSLNLQGASQLSVSAAPVTLSSPFGNSALLLDGDGTLLRLTDTALELLGLGNATATVQFGAAIQGQGASDILVGLSPIQLPGLSGRSQMFIQAGGTVSASNVTVTGGRFNPAELGVSDPGSQLTATDTLSVVGGSVNLRNEATATAKLVNIQGGELIDGRITVETGAKLTVTATAQLSEAVTVGSSGIGTLEVTGGGSGSATVPLVLGVQPGSTGRMTISGANSAWQNGDAVIVGYQGTGTLTVETLGQLTTLGASLPGRLSGVIGSQEGSTGTVTVDGGMWNQFGNLQIGASGTGTLTVQSGGQVTNEDAVIGVADGAAGTVTVTGPRAEWANAGDLTVGSAGKGTLTIADRGHVSSANAVIAGDFHGSGSVTVTGPQSEWTNSGNLTVGGKADAVLTVSDGGRVTSVEGKIGADAPSAGTATVTGSESVWRNSGQLTVGLDGSAKLTVTERGLVTAQAAVIAAHGGPASSVEVSLDGALEIGNGLTVGAGGDGSLTVSAGGQVRSGSAQIGESAGSRGSVTVSGASLSAPSTWQSSGVISVGSVAAQGNLFVQDGGHLIADQVIVNPLGTFDGRGGFIAATVVNNGGIVTPGDATGIMTITGDYVQHSGTLLFEIDGPLSGQFDQLLISGFANLDGGTIQIIFGGGFLPVGGEDFDLISALLGLTAGDIAIDVLGLPAGLKFVDTFTSTGLSLAFEQTAPPPVNPAPEPGTLALLCAALLSLPAARYRSAGRSAGLDLRS